MKYRAIFVSSVALFLSATAVFAQDAIHPSELELARKTYVDTLDAYRSKEQKFFVIREQYKQLQTLASLEDAVKASKDVQISRIDTLLAYFNTLQLYVNDLKGADLQKKADISQRLQQVVLELGISKQQVQKATDRIALDKLSTSYESRNTIYISTAYATLSLIRIANMQTATDQLGLLSSQVFETIQSSSPSANVLSEKQRGYDELSRTIGTIKEFITKAMNRYDSNAGNEYTQSTYTQLVDLLGSGFTKLKQGESFIKELAQ